MSPSSNRGRARKSAPAGSGRSPRSATTRGSARSKGKPRLLAGDNPQVAKGDGDEPVREYLAAIPGWKRAVAHRIDALITKTVRDVRKAVKWNSPFYGLEGRGWIVALHVFSNYVKVTFFHGASLRPPPAGGTGANARWLDVHEDDLDEARLASWLKRAAALPGWGRV